MVRCDTRLDPLRVGTELHFAFYRDGRTVRGYNVSDTYRVRSSQLEDSGKYTCDVRTTSDTVRKMSDGLYIKIHVLTDNELPVAVIAAAVIGSLVVIVVSAVLIWKWKKRKSVSHEMTHQTTSTAVNNNPQDVCYTYLDISRLPKATGIKHDDLTVTYATVNNANI
ncbi:hypothetical protein AB205_0162530 [Aquarana catesbeiana]|uniref:Ig-like domain-containing protein n=1 Tax=Aquarana catesbeiana TaxID=8400 RepID=A0A2G9R858_AQUCT|nr:hypothetical protein AB205_0162530 [Aquarana catesbeiana]